MTEVVTAVWYLSAAYLMLNTTIIDTKEGTHHERTQDHG